MSKLEHDERLRKIKELEEDEFEKAIRLSQLEEEERLRRLREEENKKNVNILFYS